MSEIIKYQNDFNKLKMTNFNAMDLNVLMKICVELNKANELKIEIPFEEIKASIKYTGHKAKFITLLSEICKKVGCLEMWTEDGFEQIYLFKNIKGIIITEVLVIEVNKEYVCFFKELQKQFTAFALEDFVKLEGKYAKNLYRLLMQWKTKGHCPTEYEDKFFSIDEIKGFLNAPKDYAVKYLTDDVLKTAVTEINEKGLLKNLELVVHKAKRRGTPVIGYSFTFEPVKTKKSLTEKQKKAIEHKEAGDYKSTEELKKESKKESKSKKNSFNNYDQRNYSNEEITELEQKLLRRNLV